MSKRKRYNLATSPSDSAGAAERDASGPSTGLRPSRRTRVLSWLLFLVLTLLYLPSLRHQFVYDDEVLIIQESRPEGWVDFANIFRERHFPTVPYYRPILRLSFRFQKFVHGDTAWPYHLVNALLAGVAALVAFRLLSRPVFRIRRSVAAVAALGWALHPALSSCVYPICSGRGNGEDKMTETNPLMPALPGDERPGWDQYFMEIAYVVARRGNCSRRKVAAVAVKDRRIISTGYNGTPRGVRNCFEGGCPRCAGDAPSGADLTECLCCHAEENAITQAAYHGIQLKGATMYVTLNPCLTCAKMMINAGIAEVVYDATYRFSAQTQALLEEAGVRCRQFSSSAGQSSGPAARLGPR